jgi:four helix bundle protein
MVNSYKELIFWQKSYEVARRIYRITEDFPKKEVYWLADQMRRSAVSVPSNIAEWYGRGIWQDYLRFLAIARWSCNELETQILLAVDFGYIAQEDAEAIIAILIEVIKLITSVINKYKK